MASTNFTRRIRNPLSSVVPWGDKNYLALDIGSSSVKLLEVRGKPNGLRVLSAGIIPIPADAVQNNFVQDPEAVAEAIRSLVEEYGIKTTSVVTAVPGPAAIIKHATFPAQDPKELQETILFEAGNFIPESLENVNLDYQVLNPGTGEDAEVLLVAVRKDVLNSYVAAIERAGLTPTVVDVDYFALENMFEVNYGVAPEETVALINIGAHYSLINIMKGGRSAFTGDVHSGGRQFTQVLATELGIGEEQAEELKITGTAGGITQEEVERVLSVSSGHLTDEVQQALSFFGTGSPEDQIHAVYLSGGAAQLPGLAAVMSERLQLPVEVADPFRQLTIGRQADEALVRQNASSFAVGVGLAIRRPRDR